MPTDSRALRPLRLGEAPTAETAPRTCASLWSVMDYQSTVHEINSREIMTYKGPVIRIIRRSVMNCKDYKTTSARHIAMPTSAICFMTPGRDVLTLQSDETHVNYDQPWATQNGWKTTASSMYHLTFMREPTTVFFFAIRLLGSVSLKL